MRMDQRILPAFFAACLFTMACPLRTAAAPVALDPNTDMTYSGVVGNQGNDTGTDPGMGMGTASPVVMLEQGKSGYDRGAGKFINYVGKDMAFFFYSNVPNGIITNDPVNIDLTEGNDWTLYKDGEPMEAASLRGIEGQGAYVLSVQDRTGGQSNFTFCIVHSVTNQLNTFDVPPGFHLTDVTLDGKGITINSLNRQNLVQDGKYTASFACDEIGSSYTTTVTVDRTPPSLALANVKDGTATGEVSLEDVSPEDKLEVTLNGKPYQVSFMRKLTEHGDYKVTVTDPAGNSVSYVFTIRVYLTISSVMVFVLAGLLCAALIVYGIGVRRHVRIR